VAVWKHGRAGGFGGRESGDGEGYIGGGGGLSRAGVGVGEEEEEEEEDAAGAGVARAVERRRCCMLTHADVC
jgi:hypothetical protein